jgi:hypothetical protein
MYSRVGSVSSGAEPQYFHPSHGVLLYNNMDVAESTGVANKMNESPLIVAANLRPTVDEDKREKLNPSSIQWVAPTWLYGVKDSCGPWAMFFRDVPRKSGAWFVKVIIPKINIENLSVHPL